MKNEYELEKNLGLSNIKSLNDLFDQVGSKIKYDYPYYNQVMRLIKSGREENFGIAIQVVTGMNNPEYLAHIKAKIIFKRLANSIMSFPAYTNVSAHKIGGIIMPQNHNRDVWPIIPRNSPLLAGIETALPVTRIEMEDLDEYLKRMLPNEIK